MGLHLRPLSYLACSFASAQDGSQHLQLRRFDFAAHVRATASLAQASEAVPSRGFTLHHIVPLCRDCFSCHRSP